MNYTQNYHLPQWEESDRVMRSDFNQMCADIESGIDGAKAQAAQSDAALDQKIAAAQASADTPCFVIGTYSGNFQKQKFTVGFRPSAVIICRMYGSSTGNYDMCAVFVGDGIDGTLRIDDDGFTVLAVNQYPGIHWSGGKYCYLAFR